MPKAILLWASLLFKYSLIRYSINRYLKRILETNTADMLTLVYSWHIVQLRKVERSIAHIRIYGNIAYTEGG